jgi:hypothetical protein
MSPEAFKATVAQYTDTSIREGSPIRTLYLLLAGRKQGKVNKFSGETIFLLFLKSFLAILKDTRMHLAVYLSDGEKI